MISNTLLSELHEILIDEYGIDLDKKALTNTANGLINYFDTLLKIEISSPESQSKRNISKDNISK